MAGTTVNINEQKSGLLVSVGRDASTNSVSVTDSNTSVNVTAPNDIVTIDGTTIANTVTINSQSDITKLLSITEQNDTVTVTEPAQSKIVTVTTPGPPGPPLASITETDSLVTLDRNLELPEYIFHKDDANTFMQFTDNRIRFNAGGIQYLDLNDASSAPHDITFNRGNNNVDLNIQGGSDSNLVFTDASTDRVGIGTNTPSFKLDVDGDIRVTGGLIVDSNYNNSSIHATNILLTNAVKYTDSGGDARFAIQFDNDVVALSNRASNGKVQIRANTSTAGSGGEVTVAEFEDDRMVCSAANIDFTNLPTSDPGVAGRLYNDSNTLKISAG